MEVRIRNAAGTRSTLIKTQFELDIIRDVLNLQLSLKKFEAECLKRLNEAGCEPDFEGPDAKWDFASPVQALKVLSRIEYSSDGFVKRYPDADEYQAAVSFLKTFHKVA